MTSPGRRLFSPLPLLLVAVATLSACAAPAREEAPKADPSASVTSSSPSPTATPVVRTEPVPPVEGACDGLVGDPRFAAAVGTVDAVSATDRPWSIGFETVGGLACTVEAERFSGDVFALPEGVVSPAISTEFAEPACRRVYDSIECTASTSTNGLWVLAMTLGRESMENQPAPAELVSTVDTAARILAEGDPLGVTPSQASWGHALNCDRAGMALNPPAILGSGEIYPSRYQEGRGPLDLYLADALGTSPRCDWMQVPDWQEIGFVVLPDAGWAWERVSAGSKTTMVGDRTAIVRDDDDRLEVYVSDGVNLLQVSSVNLSEADTVAAADSVLSFLTAAP